MGTQTQTKTEQELREWAEQLRQKLGLQDVTADYTEKEWTQDFDLYDEYVKAKNIIDDLSSRVIDTGAAKSLPEVATSGLMSRNAFIKQVQNNTENGGYLSRQYQLFNDDSILGLTDIIKQKATIH